MRIEVPLITSKRDHAAVAKLIEIGFPTIRPVLPYMFQWIQDENWPVAQPLMDYFVTLGVEVVPEVQRVLITNDAEWKRSCLMLVTRMGTDVVRALENDLRVLAEHPTPNENSSGVEEFAGELLRRISDNDAE